MGETTAIAWTHHTFNIAHGCLKVSPGCAHCYAETLTHRWTDRVIWGPPATTDRRTFGPEHWHKPELWNLAAARSRRRRRVFASSMCDVFEDHPTITRERAKLWPLIAGTPWLDWLILTKRAERIAPNLPANWPTLRAQVWLGVSIENNDYVGRADAIRALDATVRFVSYEPALGPVDRLNLAGLDWLIVGGESGPGYRPMDLAWVRDLRRRCTTAGVAVFFKQSAAPRTEMGIRLDGRIVRHYPTRRYPPPVGR